MTEALAPPRSPDELAIERLCADLHARAETFASEALAKSTRRVYVGEWKGFVAFCAALHLCPLPADPGTVRWYLAHLAERRRPAGIDVALAAICHAHTRHDFPSPRSDRRLLEVRSGIRRTLGAAPRPKAAVTPGELHQMTEALPDTALAVRDRALLRLGFIGAFRPAELAALQIEDLTFVPRRDRDRPEVRILVRRSKTDQEGMGLLKIVPPAKDAAACPVVALLAWLELLAALGRKTGPLWPGQRLGRFGEHPLSRRDISRIMKRTARRGGLDAEPLAGVSLRSGFVTAAIGAGKSIPQIMLQTGHRRPETVLRYARTASLSAGAAEGLL